MAPPYAEETGARLRKATDPQQTETLSPTLVPLNVKKTLPLDQKLEKFFWEHNEEPHASRRKELLKKYPQIRKLMRHEPLTKYIVVVEVVLQMAMAWYFRNKIDTAAFWISAYVIGGTLTSSLVLSIHEVTHFLAFKAFLPNKILACFANLPIVLPFCVDFKRYHMDHHRFQGVAGIDGDLPTELEGSLFNSTIGKLFFCAFQIIFYAVRPKLTVVNRAYKLPTTTMGWIFSWFTMNYVFQFSVMALVFKYWGIQSILYLLLSVFFGGSLHPMAGHFIAEHYVVNPGQETYSYYGGLNLLAFNVGYHNEHHDFPNIPWTLLPELRKIAPEFYAMPQCKSWTMTIVDFIRYPAYGPYSRIKRNVEDMKARVAESIARPSESDEVESPGFVGKEDK
ncbi:hypothetical protein HDU76_012372 [Blyttiomyces sp. JEL0837]|nr:hypothetical protein HDU76_012372 [Blyttiomyces sp. JEL0837]